MKGETNGILLNDLSNAGQDSQGYLRPESKKVEKSFSQLKVYPAENDMIFPGYLKPIAGQNGSDLGFDQKYSIGQESQSYLHPTSKGIPGTLLSPKNSHDEGQLPQRKMKGKRFDSGVADLDQVSPDLSMETSPKFRPPSKYNYDYADYAAHQYEELPHNREKYHDRKFMEAGDSRSEHQSSGGTTVTDIQSDLDDTAAIVRNNEKRKRVNPLYDHVNQSTPSIYTKSRPGKDVILKKKLNCLKIVVVLLTFLLLVTFAFCVYTFVTQLQEQKKMQETVDSLQERYSTLQNKFDSMEQLLGMNDTTELFDTLMKKITDLENLADTHYSVLEDQIESASTNIAENTGNIFHVFSNVTEQLFSMNISVQEQVDAISKMPGPEGPRGVGNLTACFYRNITSSKKVVSALSPPSTTLWYPHSSHNTSTITLENYVPMFVSCAVDGGTYHHVETNVITENLVQYRCYCTGYVAGMDDRYCYMHLWLCPRITDPSSSN